MAGDLKFRFTGDQFEAVYDDDIADVLPKLGRYEIKRASYVEPAKGGGWTADMSPLESGIILGPYPLREEALNAERQWIRKHRGL